MATSRTTTPIGSEQARDLYLKIARSLESLGYFVGWYGSTVYGEGADVDILVVPKRPDPYHVLPYLQRLGEVEDKGFYEPAGFHNYFVTIDGFSVDLHVFKERA